MIIYRATGGLHSHLDVVIVTHHILLPIFFITEISMAAFCLHNLVKTFHLSFQILCTSGYVNSASFSIY